MKGVKKMSVQSAFDSMLEDKKCPECGTVGMNSIGGWEYECPNCGNEGTLGK